MYDISETMPVMFSGQKRARGKRGAGRKRRQQEFAVCAEIPVAPQTSVFSRAFHAIVTFYLTVVYALTKFVSCSYRSIVASIRASVKVTNEIFFEAFAGEAIPSGVPLDTPMDTPIGASSVPSLPICTSACGGPVTELKILRGGRFKRDLDSQVKRSTPDCDIMISPGTASVAVNKPSPVYRARYRDPYSPDEVDQFMMDTLMEKLGEPPIKVYFKDPVSLDDDPTNLSQCSNLPQISCDCVRDAYDADSGLCRHCMWQKRVDEATERMYQRAFEDDKPRAKTTIKSCNCVRGPGDPHIGLCSRCKYTVHAPNGAKQVFRHANEVKSNNMNNILIRGKPFAHPNSSTAGTPASKSAAAKPYGMPTDNISADNIPNTPRDMMNNQNGVSEAVMSKYTSKDATWDTLLSLQSDRVCQSQVAPLVESDDEIYDNI